MSTLQIRPLQPNQVDRLTDWARREGFAPGLGDVEIYRHTDRQGLWIGWLGSEPVGCIAGVKYNLDYGFIGLYIVVPEHRGQGYGRQLWQHALDHLAALPCVGLEAAINRIEDYAGWGFRPASPTSRWQRISRQISGEVDSLVGSALPEGLRLLEGEAIPQAAVQLYDAQRELSPRPHFLADWLAHRAGTVKALIDGKGRCHGFGRIRPCLLPREEGWRIGPLLADTPGLAALLIQQLLIQHQGVVLIDSPGANPGAAPQLADLGFERVGGTLRMYRGSRPAVPLDDVYGLACLELG
jgi:ribosomal-protein-alanine N-acetyltransferase